MNQVLRIDNADPLIVYDSSWKVILNSADAQDGRYSLATTPAAQFFLQFRGTSIKFYGRLGGGGGSLQFRLDGRNLERSSNGTNFADGPTPVFTALNLEDGDHQLFVYVISLQQNGTVAVDYFDIENSSGRGFNLLWAGPNATNVPKEAVIVDNSSPDIVFSNPSQWGNVDNVQFYKRSLSYTNTAGASLSYSFDGVAIWYYSAVDIPHGFFTISIDGSTPQRINGKNDVGQLAQQMLWSKTDLTPGRHTFTLTQDDANGTAIDLDFFRILRGVASTAAVPSSTSTSADAIAPKSNVVPLAVGLTFGLLTLIAVVLGAFYLQRRRRRRSADLTDAQATPLYRIPPTQVDQRSGWLPDGKRRPQPTQSPTLRSTLSPGVSMATTVSTMSIGTPELELPPSYESHVRTGRATTAESPSNV